jgi:hypothetical protein
VHGVNAFLTAFPAASTQAMHQGFRDIGVEDNSVLRFSELMDSSSRFLTATADTIYYISFIDLSEGPMVVETPPMALGTVDDMWFHWIIDFGLPGDPTGGRAGSSCSPRPATTGRCPKEVSSSATRAPTGRWCSAARSSRTMTPPRRWRRSSPP